MNGALAVLVVAAASIGAAAEPSLIGGWAYNDELSSEEKPKQSSGPVLRGLSGGVVVGGLPIPLPGGGSSSPEQTGSAKDPDALYAQIMTLEEYDDRILVVYDNLGSREFVPGRHLGRKTTWNGRKLTESYETTTRKVRQRYQLDRDGRMTVTITIAEKGGKKRVYKRIFDRLDGATAADT